MNVLAMGWPRPQPPDLSGLKIQLPPEVLAALQRAWGDLLQAAWLDGFWRGAISTVALLVVLAVAAGWRPWERK